MMSATHSRLGLCAVKLRVDQVRRLTTAALHCGGDELASAHTGKTYALANKGHDTRAIQAWLGHRSITSAAIYTALAPNRFKDFWRD
jgi:site-specific recombinase XerD